MDEWKKDARRDVVFVEIDALVPQDHLLRKIEKVMDYDWLYERLDPYYCHDNGRPGTDPVVLIKMVLIQHLYGIPSLRQTYQRIQDTLSYRWFLGYGLLDEIPHFATVSYAFCKRFPAELTEEIFAHILNKALNHRMVDPKMIFMDGTHIKASANKKKFQKEKVAKAAKVYAEQLREEVNAEREKLGKKTIEDEDDDDSTPGGGTVERTVSTTDPESGMFVKGDHERQFAYEATPWIAKKTLDDGRIPILPYTNHHRKQDTYKPWEYEYDPKDDCFTCPQGGKLRHTTTDREGKRTYRSDTKHCKSCPFKGMCGANEKGQKLLTTHIWQEYLDLVEQLRRTERGKEIYAMRKETIERVFADAKEKHAMRYTHHRGLARVTSWVRLKYAAMNLKKLAEWSWNNSFLRFFFSLFLPFYAEVPAFA